MLRTRHPHPAGVPPFIPTAAAGRLGLGLLRSRLPAAMDRREPRHPPPNSGPSAYREDCWTEGETAALIDAWGERYVELNRGNLRQPHWNEVADAVNSFRRASSCGGPRRLARTDVQCKNRVDTLKKKYKAERARIVESGGAGESPWPFYSRIHFLIGSPAAASHSPSPSPMPLALHHPYRRKAPSPLPPALEWKRPKGMLPVNDLILRSTTAAAAAREEDSASDTPTASQSRSSGKKRPHRGGGSAGGPIRERDGEGVRELTRAVEKLAEIYQRVEGAKLQQMMELEKKRMEFTKALEFERMQVFVDTQVQLAKIGSNKQADAGEQESPTDVHLLFDEFQTMCGNGSEA